METEAFSSESLAQVATKMPGLYNRLMALDRRIRFAALVTDRGEIIEGGMRENVQPIEPLEKTPKLIAQLVAKESAEARAEFLGSPLYSIMVHDHIVAVILYTRENIVLVTAERSIPFKKLEALERLVFRSRGVRKLTRRKKKR
jgi:hypothetical protein